LNYAFQSGHPDFQIITLANKERFTGSVSGEIKSSLKCKKENNKKLLYKTNAFCHSKKIFKKNTIVNVTLKNCPSSTCTYLSKWINKSQQTFAQ
jgi:hypothetical protein